MLYESCRVEVWAQNGRHGAQKVAGALLNPSLRQLNAIYDTFFSAPYLSSCRDWLKGFTNKFYSPQVRRGDRVPLESSTHAFIWLLPVLQSKYFSSIWISIKSRLIICSSQRLACTFCFSGWRRRLLKVFQMNTSLVLFVPIILPTISFKIMLPTISSKLSRALPPIAVLP